MSISKIIAGNWKMNTNLQEAVHLVQSINNELKKKQTNNTIIVAPPFVYLTEVIHQLINNNSIKVAAQNCAQFDNGAYTGEVSATMLNNLEIPYVIIGHSERRQYFNETATVLLNKVHQALKHQLKIIFCCGEDLTTREANTHFTVIQQQLETTIFKLNEKEIQQIIIAYEPIWAIGTGKTATIEQAQEMHAFIRQQVAKQFNETIALNCKILYGGSVKPNNAKALLSCNDIDGALVGGASLNASDFLDIIYSI